MRYSRRADRVSRSALGPAALALAMAVGWPGALFAELPKNVLIVSGEARNLPGNRILLDSIQSTMRRDSARPIEFYIETIDLARFGGAAYEIRVAQLYREKYGQIRLDLVVAFTEPAVDFVLRHRAEIFPDAPLLLGLVERRLAPRAMPPNAGLTLVEVDAVAALDLARRTYPALRNVLVVGGTARFDRMWQTVVRDDLEHVTNVAVVYDVDSTVDALVEKVRGLPKDTVVLFVSMSRDGAGVPTASTDVLQRLRAVAPVPIYGLSSTYLGLGIVGGALLDFDRHGADMAHMGLRLLAGDRPATLTTPATVAVDWREMRRFGMETASLPASAIVAFREPTLWEREKNTFIVVGLIIAAETALLVALVWHVRRRRETQRLLEGRLRFEILLSDLTRSLVEAAGSLDAALGSALGRVATGLGFSGAWYWTFGQEDWDSPQLRTGHPLLLAPVQLPPTIQERIREAGGDACTCIATPLPSARIVTGALFWALPEPAGSWLDRVGELRLIANAVANVLQRRQAEGALEQSDRLKGAILSSLPAQVAVLDREGTIIAVNDAWIEFGQARGADVTRIGVGASYLDACETDRNAGFAGGSEAARAVRVACSGGRTGAPVEYRCETEGGDRWFLMRAEPLRRLEGGAVVTHSDITERKIAEQTVKDVNRRLLVAQEDERRRIARELHDHLNQQLALLAISLQQLVVNPPESGGALTTAVEDAWRLTNEIASDVHAISHRLHPYKLEALGLVATLKAHCRERGRQHLDVEFSADDDLPRAMRPEVGVCLYRVVEEALSNVTHHSGATRATVTLAREGADGVRLRIRDGGSGFKLTPGRPSGLGLVSMRERVEALGGTLTISSSQGRGTIVEAHVPRCTSGGAQERTETAVPIVHSSRGGRPSMLES